MNSRALIHKSVVTALFIFSFSSFLQSQSVDDTYTGDRINGRGWNKMGNSKIYFLVGYEEGCYTGILSNFASFPSSEAYFNNVYPQKFTRTQIISEIDKVYKEASNTRIPVYDVIRWVAMKSRGESSSVLEEDLARLRKIWNK
jgi:hypothetical protein